MIKIGEFNVINKKNKKSKFFRKIRWNVLRLIRLKANPSIIARGYALGILIEFITLPTLGLAFLLLYPLTILFRANFGASLIGFISGKFIMLFFLYWNYQIGNILVGTKISEEVEQISHFISITMLREQGLAFFLGSIVNGTIVALVSYIIVYYGVVFYRKRKEMKS